MKSTVLLKIVACAASGLVLGSCTQALMEKKSGEAQRLASAEVVRELRATKTLQQELSAFLEATSRALASYEDRLLPYGGESRLEILGELSRLCFILGELGEKQDREQRFQKGRLYAELLRQEQPQRVEGHYWLALNLGGLAATGGAARGLTLVSVIVEKLQTALVIDEHYDQAGPHRVLGRVRYAAPDWPLSEGDLNDSLRHLRAAVRIAPGNSTNHLFLAETLIQLGKDEEAVRELERVVASTQHAVWSHGFQEDHQEALLLLTRYQTARHGKRHLKSTEILALPTRVP